MNYPEGYPKRIANEARQAEMVEMRKKGFTYQQIADKYSVSFNCVLVNTRHIMPVSHEKQEIILRRHRMLERRRERLTYREIAQEFNMSETNARRQIKIAQDERLTISLSLRLNPRKIIPKETIVAQTYNRRPGRKKKS